MAVIQVCIAQQPLNCPSNAGANRRKTPVWQHAFSGLRTGSQLGFDIVDAFVVDRKNNWIAGKVGSNHGLFDLVKQPLRLRPARGFDLRSRDGAERVGKAIPQLLEQVIMQEQFSRFWFADPNGLGTPGYGLCMSAADMAKIGQLCLNKGIWEGNRIVSEEWISAMTCPRTVESNYFRGMQYGYLWWIIHPEKNIYAAIGNSGNVIYVNPEEKIVVSVSSYFKPTVFDRVDFIEDNLLPCFK